MLEALALGLGLSFSVQEAEIDVWRRRCAQGGADACAELGVLLIEQDVSNQNTVEIAAILDTACEAGSGRACGELSQIYLEGRGGLERDWPRAYLLANRGCELGFAVVACANLGLFLWEGELAEQDRKKAVELFRSSCVMNDWGGCQNLANAHFYGEEGVVEIDYAQSAVLFAQACALGSAEACVMRSVHLLRGLGVTQDVTAARIDFRRYCQEGDRITCQNLADAWWNYEATRDSNRALYWITRACELEAEGACEQMEYVTEQIESGATED